MKMAKFIVTHPFAHLAAIRVLLDICKVFITDLHYGDMESCY